MIYAVRKVNALRLKRSSPKTIEFRSVRNYCKEDFIKDLHRINWVSTLEPMSDSPNEMASVFIDIFEKLLKVHAPLKKWKVRSEYTPWLTSDIEKSMKDRDKLKKFASKDPKLWPIYKTLRNRVTNSLRLSVRKYYQDLVTKSKNNPKNMWKTIDKILHKTSGTTAISELKYEEVIVKNQIQIVETLNEHCYYRTRTCKKTRSEP